MHKLYYSNARSGALSEIDSPKNGMWLHIVAPDAAELEQLAKRYELDVDLLNDAVDLYEAPRVENSEGDVYVYTRYYHPNHAVINATEPLLIVYKPNMIVTVQRVNTLVLDPLISGRQQVITTQKTKSLLQILSLVNSSYQVYITQVTRNILSVRSQLKRTDITNEALLNFVEMEDDLNEFLGTLQPHAVMLRNLLGGKYIRLYEEDKDLVEDLSLTTSELLELVKSRLKTLVSIREAYDAIAASELNRTFRRLTSISIFLMLPTIFFSLYGMNVRLPFDKDPQAVWYVVSFVLVFTLTTIWYFRRKRWI